MSRYSYYSIIVPSYNRREEIGELIESFLNLEFPPERFELIIADDGSSDGTEQMVNSYKEKAPFPLHFLRQENLGPGAARNMGMAHASGDFFIFIDSDCTVSPEWLKAIDDTLNAQQADAFGGPDSQRPDFPPLLKAINYSMTSFITTGGIRGHKKKKLGKYYPRSFNMGLSRALYQKVGGFGKLRHGQDIEYSHRIIQSGARVVQILDAIVYHKRRTSLTKFFRQVFNWGVARINLYKIDSAMLEPVHALPALATLIIFTLLVGSFLNQKIGIAFLTTLLIGIFVLLISGLHAAVQTQDVRMLVLVPLIMPIQILGYGLGFITGFIQRMVLRRPEFVGFRKRYYG